jgi:hypothetical protein
MSDFLVNNPAQQPPLQASLEKEKEDKTEQKDFHTSTTFAFPSSPTKRELL